MLLPILAAPFPSLRAAPWSCLSLIVNYPVEFTCPNCLRRSTYRNFLRIVIVIITKMMIMVITIITTIMMMMIFSDSNINHKKTICGLRLRHALPTARRQACSAPRAVQRRMPWLPTAELKRADLGFKGLSSSTNLKHLKIFEKIFKKIFKKVFKKDFKKLFKKLLNLSSRPARWPSWPSFSCCASSRRSALPSSASAAPTACAAPRG